MSSLRWHPAARCALALAVCAALSACRTDFNPPWHITGLRVIAVTLDPPVLAPGGTSHVHVVAVDTAHRTLSTHWVACPPTAGQPTPTSFRCPSPLARTGDDDSFDLTAPALPLTGPSGLGSIPVALRAMVCADGTVTVAPDGTAACSGTDAWETTRTLPLSASVHNQNPGVMAVTLDTTPWTADTAPAVPVCTGRAAGCGHAIQVVVDPAAREAYSSSGGDAGITLTERLTTHFYTTDGSLASGSLGDPSETITSDMTQTWTAPATPGTVTFWFVLDDGRGGVTEVSRTLTVTP